ncbi:hypothetical protein [Lutibacter sp.]|uniref:hypothetical protein n=1 Tax=Lutibacter sp. TaxID=1925666 RepID=UPI003563A5B9
MKKVWNLIAIALVITTTACGQQRGGQGQQGGQQGPPAAPTAKEIKTMVTDLAKEILLTEEQQETVLDLYTAHFEEVESAMEGGRPEREEMEALKSDFETKVKAVLTADQQKLYTAFLKKKASERPSK